MSDNDFQIKHNECGAYRAGHEVHYIHALKSAEDHSGWPASVWIDDDGLIVIESPEGASLWWNHNPDRLAAILNAAGGQGFAQPKWHMLRVPLDQNNYAFNLAPSTEVTPCGGLQLRGTHSGLLRPAPRRNSRRSTR